MKRSLTALTLIIAASAAYADKSDRYNDLRLDTSSAVFSTSDPAAPATIDATRAQDLRLNTTSQINGVDVTLSSRNKEGTSGEGYIYGGFGPGNDSR